MYLEPIDDSCLTAADVIARAKATKARLATLKPARAPVRVPVIEEAAPEQPSAPEREPDWPWDYADPCRPLHVWYDERSARGGVQLRTTVMEIIRFVASHYDLTVAEIIGANRSQALIGPRHIAAWLACKVTDRSFPYIGQRMCRDHTTVRYARDKVNKAIDAGDKLGEEAKRLLALFEMRYHTKQIGGFNGQDS